jgi:hypothetical protein
MCKSCFPSALKGIYRLGEGGRGEGREREKEREGKKEKEREKEREKKGEKKHHYRQRLGWSTEETRGGQARTRLDSSQHSFFVSGFTTYRQGPFWTVLDNGLR